MSILRMFDLNLEVEYLQKWLLHGSKQKQNLKQERLTISN